MTAPLEACARGDQRAVIHFLDSEGEKVADTFNRMKRQYRDTCMSLQQLYKWHRKSKSGVENLPNAAPSGQSHTANRPGAKAEVEGMIR